MELGNYFFYVELMEEQELDNLGFGFFVFLMLESVVFISFFVIYIILWLINKFWFFFGVDGLDVIRGVINIMVLVISSGVIILVEKVLY